MKSSVPNSKEMDFCDKKVEATKHRFEWCTAIRKHRFMRCGRSSKHMKMPGKCEGPRWLGEDLKHKMKNGERSTKEGTIWLDESTGMKKP